MDIRKDVQAVIDGILAGKILETFDRYYADDVVMSENGAETTTGKAANRAREEAFVANVTVTAGASLTGWKVTMTLPGGASVSSIWGGVNSGTTGTVTVTNAAYNGTLAPGSSTSFGFQGGGTGSGTTVSCSAA